VGALPSGSTGAGDTKLLVLTEAEVPCSWHEDCSTGTGTGTGAAIWLRRWHWHWHWG